VVAVTRLGGRDEDDEDSAFAAVPDEERRGAGAHDAERLLNL
jgi:hypothetical protein